MTAPTRPTATRGDVLRALAEVVDDLDPTVTLDVMTAGGSGIYAAAHILVMGKVDAAGRVRALAQIAAGLSLDLGSLSVGVPSGDPPKVHVETETRWRGHLVRLVTVIPPLDTAELDTVLTPLRALIPAEVTR